MPQALPVLGFVIATALAAAYLTWRLGSRPLESVVIGVGTSVGIYVIFRLVLGLSLAERPAGLLRRRAWTLFQTSPTVSPSR